MDKIKKNDVLFYFWLKVIIGGTLALILAFVTMNYRITPEILIIVGMLAITSVVLVASSIADIFMKKIN